MYCFFFTTSRRQGPRRDNAPTTAAAAAINKLAPNFLGLRGKKKKQVVGEYRGMLPDHETGNWFPLARVSADRTLSVLVRQQSFAVRSSGFARAVVRFVIITYLSTLSALLLLIIIIVVAVVYKNIFFCFFHHRVRGVTRLTKFAPVSLISVTPNRLITGCCEK